MSGLRPYQCELVSEVIATFNGGVRTAVMQLGTGGGKTHTAAEIIAYATNRGHRVLFLAHLDSLIGDTHARLTRAGIRAGFVQADRPVDPTAPVQVASLQTLHVRGERPPADFIILDECHRVMGATVRALLEAYPEAWILGLTATPQRGDGKPLGAVFQKLITGPSNRWLTDHGHLVPCEVLAPAGYREKDLVDDPVAAYTRDTPGRRAIVFASSVAHARALTKSFAAAGYPSGLIIGSTPREEREALRAQVEAGTVLVLVGVGVFIEGFDLPAIEVVVLARAFAVTGAFLQSIGRGLRPSAATGKTTCTVLDLRGSVHIHGLPDEERRWSLTGKACVRTETMTALRRCKECLAIFRPASKCPRCGASHEVVEKIPRTLKRAEKLEKLNDVPQEERDRRWFWACVARLRRMPKYAGAEERAKRTAAWIFEKRFGRKVA